MKKAEMSVILLDNNDVIATSGLPTHYRAGRIRDTDMAAEILPYSADGSGLGITPKGSGTSVVTFLTPFDWTNDGWVAGDNIYEKEEGEFQNLEVRGVYIFDSNNGYTPCTDLNNPFLHHHDFLLPQGGGLELLQ